MHQTFTCGRCHPGFTHAAFTLGYEACLNKNTINGNDVPPGALISFIQKGVQYLEMETSVDQVRTLPTYRIRYASARIEPDIFRIALPSGYVRSWAKTWRATLGCCLQTTF